MIQLPLRSFIIICFVITSFVSYGQVVNRNLKFDTSRTAIIEFDSKSNWPYDNNYIASALTQKELQAVDSFLLVCVTEFNNSLENDYKRWSIDLKKRNYRKQLVVVINKEAQKEVWVNCFCRADSDKWKTEIVEHMDGGNCYFRFKINLTLRTYFDFSLNSVG